MSSSLKSRSHKAAAPPPPPPPAAAAAGREEKEEEEEGTDSDGRNQRRKDHGNNKSSSSSSSSKNSSSSSSNSRSKLSYLRNIVRDLSPWRMRGVDSGDDECADDGLPIDDQLYVRRMKEILEAFPMKGPPYSAVKLSEHVYIGSQRNADDTLELQRLGITFVLNCAGTRKFDLSRSPYPKGSGIDGYLMIPAEDHEHYDMMRHIPDAVNFLDKVRKRGGKALVHCNLGINRSGAICAAYLMNADRMSLLRVTQYLKMKRSVVLCNKGFRKQLVRYARVLGLLDPISEVEKACKSKTSNSLSPGYKPSRAGHERSSSFTSTYCTLPRGRSRKASGEDSTSENDSVRNSGLYPPYTSRDSSLQTIRENGRDQTYSPTDEHRRQIRADVAEAAPGEDTPSYLSKGKGQASLISWHRTASSPSSAGSKSRADDAESQLSTSRPLRVYRRSATDTELYQRPSSTNCESGPGQAHRHSEPAGTGIASSKDMPDRSRPSASRENGETHTSSSKERSSRLKDNNTASSSSSSSRWADNDVSRTPRTTTSVLDKYRASYNATTTTTPTTTTTSPYRWSETIGSSTRADGGNKSRLLDFSESYGGTLRRTSPPARPWHRFRSVTTSNSRAYKY